MTTDTEPEDPATVSLHERWAEDNGDYVNDLIGSAEQAADDAQEPEDTLALACAAAIGGESLGKALDHPWALYTPQDAAVVASALQAQAGSLVSNLRQLAEAVEYIAARGEVDIPEASGLVPSEAENLTNALDRLRGIADGVEEPLEGIAVAAASLNRAPAGFQRAQSYHDNLRAVTALLGDGVTVLACPPEDAGLAVCRCSATIVRNGETYYLNYQDSTWSLLADSQGTPLPGGGKGWVNGGSFHIDAKEALAHPRQLADEVLYYLG